MSGKEASKTFTVEILVKECVTQSDDSMKDPTTLNNRDILEKAMLGHKLFVDYSTKERLPKRGLESADVYGAKVEGDFAILRTGTLLSDK